jgi:hypothetical protein
MNAILVLKEIGIVKTNAHLDHQNIHHLRKSPVRIEVSMNGCEPTTFL